MVSPEARTRRFVVAFGLAALTALVLAAPALADTHGSGLQPYVPQADSPNGRNIFNLYALISIPAILIFLLVEGLLLTIVIRFRRSRQPAGYVPPQWHGNNVLEVAWTVVPLVIILSIAFVSFLELKNDFDPTTFAAKAGSDPAKNVVIHGYRFGWKVHYVEDGVDVNMVGRNPEPMVVPVNTLIRIQTEGDDVIHSWWVPYLMGKTDAVPGYSNYTWIKPDKVGDYHGECAELCGPGHADMLIYVKVVSQSDYDSWLASQKAPKSTPSPSPSPSPASGARQASPSPSPRSTP